MKPQQKSESSMAYKQDTLVLEESYHSSKMIYDLKKEVLDKLDIILQRVNLEVIAAMEECNVSDFKLISMSQLQPEISDLFVRLDNCVQRREKSLRINDNSVTFSNGSLIKENQLLKTQIQSLNNYIHELENATKHESGKTNVYELKKQVQNLNSQIEKYEKMWRNVDLNPKHLDSHKLKRIYMKADRVVTQSIKLKQICIQITKMLKQYSEFMVYFTSQSMQKLSSMMNDSRYHSSALVSENALLKSEIQNWQYDIQHYVQPKLLALLGSHH